MSDEPHQYNLRWRNHRKNFFDELENLFKTDLLTDINLILEGGRVVPCHKMVLATTSLAFRDFLLKNPEALDMIIPGVTYDQMRTLLEYMYSGQAQIMYSELSSLLKVAEQLKIKGLTTDAETDGSNSPSSSVQEGAAAAEESAGSPPPTISTSTNDRSDDKPAESSSASPPPSAHSTGNIYDYYKYSSAYNMPAFPSLTPFPIPQYAAAMAAAAASEYYGSLHKFKDTPILRNVLHQNSHEESMDHAEIHDDKTRESAASMVSSVYDEGKYPDVKPENFYKVKKEFMERVQQQQQSEQCESTENTSTPPKSGKQKVDWKRYKQYSPDDLNRAINSVIEGEMSALKASQVFSVPSRTLYDKIKRLKSQKEQGGSPQSPDVGNNRSYRNKTQNYGMIKRFYSMLTPENLRVINEQNLMNSFNTIGSDAMSNESNSPPAWQQSNEDEAAQYNMSPAHSAASKHSNSDCEMAEDLSVKKSPGTPKIKQEIITENCD